MDIRAGRGGTDLLLTARFEWKENRSTLANWVGGAAWRLSPNWELGQHGATADITSLRD